MTKADREARIAEAIEWMREDGGKFPGWGEDKLAKADKVANALLESLLLAYPNIRLVPVLAACRAHWIARSGPATRKAWCARIQNWAKTGAEWDPLITGRPRSVESAQSIASIESQPCRTQRTPHTQQTQRTQQTQQTPVAAGDVVKGELAKIKERLGG